VAGESLERIAVARFQRAPASAGASSSVVRNR
jgi:hypothetical protein